MLKLTVLGTAASYPRAGMACSGYLLADGPEQLLVDLGAGSLTNLREGVDPGDLDAVLLSHLHPDHYSDIFTLSIYLEFFSGRSTRMPLYAPPGSDTTLGKYPWRSPKGFEGVFDFVPWVHNEVKQIGSFLVRAVETNHAEPTFALDVKSASGSRMTYTSDTGPSSAVQELANGTGLLLAEASWPETPSGASVGHMTAEEAGTMAAAAGAGQLVLTHFLPSVDNDKAVAMSGRQFRGPISIAEIGRTYEVDT